MDGKDDRRRRAPNRVFLQLTHPSASSSARPLRLAARRFLLRLGLHGSELSISLVGDPAIRRLNRSWRRIDKATDVLSFPAGKMPANAPGPRLLGDVVISVDMARRRAGRNRRELDAELARYLAHGLLHLLGYDHQTRSEAASMSNLERRLLGERGLI